MDAQLPRRLALLLAAAGNDALHTLNLPRANETPDEEIRALCARENRILVTKDTGFSNSFFLKREPQRLLLISTGNITNRDLESLFRTHLAVITDAFASNAFIEVDRFGMTIHG